MHTGVTHIAFETLGIFKGLAYEIVLRREFRSKLRDIFITVTEIGLKSLSVGTVGHALGHKVGQAVTFRQRKLLDTRHILDSRLGGHGAERDNMGHLLLAVTLCHIMEHISAAIIVEVDVDIRQRDTVGVKESFEKEIILYRVDLSDAEAVGHHTTGRRSTSGTNAHTEFVSGHIDEVLHDKEVTRETHGLHYIELEAYALLQFRSER